MGLRVVKLAVWLFWIECRYLLFTGNTVEFINWTQVEKLITWTLICDLYISVYTLKIRLSSEMSKSV